MRTAGRILVVAGVLVFAGAAGFWLSRGANTGWTKTYVEIEKVDDVTGIRYSEKRDEFVPGVDLLVPVVGAGFTCILAGVVIVRRSKSITP